MLSGFYIKVTEHFTHTFYWNAIGQSDCCCKSMPGNIQTFGYGPLSQHK